MKPAPPVIARAAGTDLPVAMLRIRPWCRPYLCIGRHAACLSANSAVGPLLEQDPCGVDWGVVPERLAAPAAARAQDLDPWASWMALSANPGAVGLLKRHPGRINRTMLCRNPAADEELLGRDPDRLNWYDLSANPGAAAAELLRRHPGRVSWYWLSQNPAEVALDLLEASPELIHWDMLSANPNPRPVRLLERHPDRVHWTWLSSNTNREAVRWLEKNPGRINWALLSENPSPEALALLEANPARIDWFHLSLNPGALHLLEANPGAIDPCCFTSNPAIFEYDYAAMRAARAPLAEALARERFHPRNIDSFEGWGF